MTVVYVDPPGPLANTTEPIDFTTTSLVTSISVEFNPQSGTGIRETVFDGTEDDGSGGDFSFLYRTSSVSGTGPYTWTIRRTGRWPADFRLRVKEAAGGGSVPWGVLYRVDFRTLPAASFPTPGNYTIDGLTWWLKAGSNNFGNDPGTVEIDARGLKIGYAAAASEFGTVNPVRRMLLPLANVPGYNPAAPVVFYTRTDGDLGGLCVCGVMDCAVDATIPTVQEYERRQSISSAGSDPSIDGARNHQIWNHTGVANATSPLIGTAPEVTGGRAIYPLDRRTACFSAFLWPEGSPPNPLTGAMNTVENSNAMRLLMLGQSGVDSSALVRDMSNMSFFAAYNNGGGPGRPAWLAELIIWQPGN